MSKLDASNPTTHCGGCHLRLTVDGGAENGAALLVSVAQRYGGNRPGGGASESAGGGTAWRDRLNQRARAR